MEHRLENAAAATGIAGMRDDDTNINISDVIDAIQTTDPDFTQSGMFSGGGELPGGMDNTGDLPKSGNVANLRQKPKVRIIEQPASKALRFRYECEGRSAGSIPGASSTPENKTFPAIQVVGDYKGRAVVVVSCVTKDPPYRPHPHNLVGREGCRKGVCTLEISPETMAVTFSNLGIQCVKKKDIEDALKTREEIRVDPYRTGFSHRNQPTSIDLNAVRLCFQVFLEVDKNGKFTYPLAPVVSDPIYDKKAMSDLVICKLSDCSCSVAGGKEIILLCEKVAKEDIQVRFYEEVDGVTVWEGFGDFQPTQVHKQVAIAFRVPRYRSLEINEPVKAAIQLRRPSDGATSEPLPFELLPLDSDPYVLKRKRQKFGNDPNNVLRQLQEQENRNRNLTSPYNMLNIPVGTSVKAEPRDTSPSLYGGTMYGGALSPMYAPSGGPSPQPQYRLDATPERIPSPMEFQAAYNPQAAQFSNMNALNIQPVGHFLGQAVPEVSPGLPNYLLVQQQMQSAQSQQQQQQTWNILGVNEHPVNNINEAVASTSAGPNIEPQSNDLFDLDSQELTQFNSALNKLDSAEFAKVVYGATLSEDMVSHLSLSDGTKQEEQLVQENVSDSFTRLTNSINNLNNLYKPGNK